MDEVKLERSMRKTALLTFKVTPVVRETLRRYAEYKHLTVASLILAPAIERLKQDDSVFMSLYSQALQEYGENQSIKETK